MALVRALADKTGLTGRLSRALASRRLLAHDRGQMLADLACAIADGAEVISDFRVMADRGGLFGLVASVPTCWRALVTVGRAWPGLPVFLVRADRARAARQAPTPVPGPGRV